MAEAKLWWDGSSWATSSKNAVSESWTGNHQLGVSHSISIVAYDDFTIKMSQSGSAYQTAAIYNNVYTSTNSVAVTSGSATIGSGNFSDADVTNYSTFSYSGSLGAAGNASGSVYYSGSHTFSGTIEPTTPFYKVTYNANGGSGAPSATKGVKGFATTLSATTPTRTNHTFLGWATSSSSHTKDYSAGATVSARSTDLTLYAVWRPAVFIQPGEGTKITFNGTAYTSNATIKNLTWGNSYTLLVEPLAGWIIKTQSHPNGSVTLNADETTISATGQRVGCHIDDGDNWVQAVIYYDNGVSWEMIQAYVDDGASWTLAY